MGNKRDIAYKYRILGKVYVSRGEKRTDVGGVQEAYGMFEEDRGEEEGVDGKRGRGKK